MLLALTNLHMISSTFKYLVCPGRALFFFFKQPNCWSVLYSLHVVATYSAYFILKWKFKKKFSNRNANAKRQVYVFLQQELCAAQVVTTAITL